MCISMLCVGNVRSSNKGIKLSLGRPHLSSLLQYVFPVCFWMCPFDLDSLNRFTLVNPGKTSKTWVYFLLGFWFHYKPVAQFQLCSWLIASRTLGDTPHLTERARRYSISSYSYNCRKSGEKRVYR